MTLGFSRQAALKRLRRNITLANVLAGDSRAPVTVEDLYLYLKHVEYSVENLQFLLWYQDYRARFFDLPEEVQKLSPQLEVFASRGRKVTFAQRAEQASRIANARSRCPHRSRFAPKVLLDVGIPSASLYDSGPLPPDHAARLLQVEQAPEKGRQPPKVPSEPKLPLDAAPAHENDTTHDYNCTASQPFRHECMRVAAVFFTQGSSHELSLDQEARELVLSNLECNTHPDVFLSAYDDVYTLIETSSFPQFLVVQSMNINMPRRVLWCILGVTDLLISIVLALCLVIFVDISSQSRRAFRLLALPFAACGTMQIFSAYQGFCTLVWWNGSTQVKEWEFSDQSIIQPVDHPPAFVDHELGMTQELPFPHTSLSQAERIAPFMIGSAVPSVAPPISLASPSGPPSRASPRTPQSASQDPLIRPSQTTHHDHNSSIHGTSDQQTAASEIAEETIDGSSARTVQAAPELVVPSFPLSTVPDQDIKFHAQTSREPSITSSKRRVRTKILGHGPVFGRQKSVLDSRIIASQGITFRSCMFVGAVTAILFASIILPMPSP